ncbi:MAG: hypothetical protein ACP5NS_03155 [Candidatus Pacearchaeota archaeon]
MYGLAIIGDYDRARKTFNDPGVDWDNFDNSPETQRRFELVIASTAYRLQQRLLPVLKDALVKAEQRAKCRANLDARVLNVLYYRGNVSNN